MNKFKFDISLRVTHPFIDPDQICSDLDMSALTKWKAGEQIKTSQGAHFSGVRECTFCRFKFKKNEDESLVYVINKINRDLKKRINFVHKIYESGGKFEYFIGWYSEGNSGEEFDAQLIKDLAELHIGLSFDFYGGVEGS